MRIDRFGIGALGLSAAALVAIATSEGYSGTAYQPLPGDKATIGFGTTESVQAGDTTTPTAALQMLLRDADRTKTAIGRCITVPVSQDELDAYVSLAYNIGTAAFCSSTLVRKLNAEDYDGACAQILRWKYYRGRVVQGLADRRRREYELCMRGH